MICLTTILIINIVIMITDVQTTQRHASERVRLARDDRAAVDLGEAGVLTRTALARKKPGPGHLRSYIL
jgi:hypothetical protein